MRLEFIINHTVRIHPMALVKFHALKDEAAKNRLNNLPVIIPTRKNISSINFPKASPPLPLPSIPKWCWCVRAIFKTNEYAHLIGGKEF